MSVQIIRLPTTENTPTATEPTSTAYRLIIKSKFEIKRVFDFSGRSVIDNMFFFLNKKFQSVTD
jgi:hypothetical protein